MSEAEHDIRRRHRTRWFYFYRDMELCALLEWTVDRLVEAVMPFRIARGSAELVLARTATSSGASR